MFYRPQDGHGLPHNPFSAIVTPRPIAWVSTRGADGIDNLAPYSFFNAIAYEPPQVMFASTGDKSDRPRGKDSVANIIETEVFCINIVEYAMCDQMNKTSQSLSKQTSEFDIVEIERTPCETIPCARIAHAPAALECRLTQLITLPGQANSLILGEVIGIYLRDTCIKNGRFDVTTFHPLARLGYRDYSKVSELFELSRPDD